MVMKTNKSVVQMHYVIGNRSLIGDSLQTYGNALLPQTSKEPGRPLRIIQRMRFEPMQLDSLDSKMAVSFILIVVLYFLIIQFLYPFYIIYLYTESG